MHVFRGSFFMIKKLFVFIYCIERVEGLFLFQLKNYLYFYIASIVLFFFFFNFYIKNEHLKYTQILV